MRHFLITGGAGFIGINTADHYLSKGHRVTVLDNFSRAGADDNLEWLRERHRAGLSVVRWDLRRSGGPLNELIEDVDVVFHFAAQVAVTTSVANPREDFEVNALGTFNLMEAIRSSSSKPIVLYSSTNKVYGRLEDLEIIETGGRYAYVNASLGVSERRSLDFYSPYGCSKGIGDQYVLDYSRIYGLNTIVFRQSCIYGPHQFGIEDQGWVAWFAIQALRDKPVTIYGDGKQVRDVLYISDLLAAFDKAITHINTTRGRAYNIGGGPRNTLSLLELTHLLEEHFGYKLHYSFDDWRPGDQLVFVSDIRRAKADFGWEPRVSPETGLEQLVAWLQQREYVSRSLR